MQREFQLLAITLVLIGMGVGLGTAGPPRSGTEGNGLSENESATLWSHDADRYLPESAYRARYGKGRTPLEALANGTDVTFKRPPATAATWTRYDFDDLTPGNTRYSVYPAHADRRDGRFVRDAHVTAFAIQPSTMAHLSPTETTRYVAPEGQVRAVVDYRVALPPPVVRGNTSVSWSLASHAVRSVTLNRGGRILARATGDRTPVLDYADARGGDGTFRLEAEVRVELLKLTVTRRGNRTRVEFDRTRETLIVSDAVPVRVYDPTASLHHATYPDGSTGIAVFQSEPWLGYTLTDSSTARVRGVWRFYTARDRRWDEVVVAGEGGTETVDSDALPVFVHAYPSEIGPRAEPVRDGPEILAVWGSSRPPPAGTLGRNVHVEVVEQPYTASYGVAIRHDRVDVGSVQVAGIVRGVNATLVSPPGGSTRQVRRSNLTLTVVNRSATSARLRVELRDGRTGDPVVLQRDSRLAPTGSAVRRGYVTVAGRRVRTDATGVATVTVTQPGIYTARYRPGTWLSHDPAYAPDTATARWHPLGTAGGWFAFLVEVLWLSVPFLVTYYVGKRALLLLRPERHSERRFR